MARKLCVAVNKLSHDAIYEMTSIALCSEIVPFVRSYLTIYFRRKIDDDFNRRNIRHIIIIYRLDFSTNYNNNFTMEIDSGSVILININLRQTQ